MYTGINEIFENGQVILEEALQMIFRTLNF